MTTTKAPRVFGVEMTARHDLMAGAYVAHFGDIRVELDICEGGAIWSIASSVAVHESRSVARALLGIESQLTAILVAIHSARTSAANPDPAGIRASGEG